MTEVAAANQLGQAQEGEVGGDPPTGIELADRERTLPCAGGSKAPVRRPSSRRGRLLRVGLAIRAGTSLCD